MSLAVARERAATIALSAPAGAVFALVAFAFVLIDAADGSPIYADTDDLVRLLQIRDLLGDRGFFDLTLPFISMPEPYVSHYSRVVDLPYFLIGEALAPLLGAEAALSAATWVFPLVLLACFCALAVYALRRVAGGRFGAVVALVTALAMAPALPEFTPDRIDHHNVQLVLMMAMLAGLVGPARRGGAAVGAAIAASVAVGLECLPFIVAGLSALSLAGVFGGETDRARMQATGLALVAASAPAAILGYGPSIMLATNCDTVSLPWLSALAGGGLILAAVPLAWRSSAFAGADGRAIAMRLASLAVPGLALAAALAVAFPDCATGNYYGVVDPLSKRLWLDTLPQEKGILHQFAAGRYPLAVFCVFWAFLLAATAPAAWRGWRSGRRELAVVWIVALSGLAAYLAIERSVRNDAALVAMLMPATIALLRGGRPFGLPASRRFLAGALAVPLAVTLAAYVATPKTPFVFTVLDQLHFDYCKAVDAGVLDDIPPSRIMAPLGAARKIVEGHPQHSVAAFTVHRAAPGMHRMFVAFTTKDPAERAAALAPFDYLAVCLRDFGFPGMEDAPLFAALLRGESVPGLVPVEPARASSFRLYRIDRAALR